MKFIYSFLFLVFFVAACQKKETSALVTTKTMAKADSVIQVRLPSFLAAIDTFYGTISGYGVNILPDTIDSPAYIYVYYYAQDSIRFSSNQYYEQAYLPDVYNSYFGLDVNYPTDSTGIYTGALDYEGQQNYIFTFKHDSLYYDSVYYHVLYSNDYTYVFYEMTISGKRISRYR